MTKTWRKRWKVSVKDWGTKKVLSPSIWAIRVRP